MNHPQHADRLHGGRVLRVAVRLLPSGSRRHPLGPHSVLARWLQLRLQNAREVEVATLSVVCERKQSANANRENASDRRKRLDDRGLDRCAR